MHQGIRVNRARAATVLALVTLAGLLMATGPEASAAAPRIVQFETAAADGTALRGDIYLPERSGPLATVLQLSPYWNTLKGPGEDQADTEDVKPFLDAGFAVALVNLRGTGESDGCFQWGSRKDWADASRIVTALAEQPWSNGNVGMYGTSYEGWSQFMAMADPPPALKAAVPISGLVDVWSLLTRDGAPISIGPVASTVFGAATSLADPEPALVTHVGCTEAIRHAEEGAGLITTGDRTPYYQQRDLRPFLRESRVPVLLSNGLQYLTEGHTLQFEGLWDLLRADRTRFVLGQWGHGGTRPGFIDLAVGWFDHYLRGAPASTATAVVDYQDDTGAWHSAPSWPPPATTTTLNLSGEQLTAPGAAVAKSARTFLSLLDGEVAAAAAELAATEEEAGKSGQNRALCGPNQVSYVSPPLEREVSVAGNFAVDLTVSSDLPGGNLVATLSHTRGTGSCTELVSGLIDSGRVQLDLRHWKQPGKSQSFPTNTPTRVRAESLPLAAVIPAGHRLVLTISAGAPEILPDPLKPAITITTGPRVPASISLPVVSGALRFR